MYSHTYIHTHTQVLGIIRGAGTDHPEFDTNVASTPEQITAINASNSESESKAESESESKIRPHEEVVPEFYKAAYGNNILPFNAGKAAENSGAPGLETSIRTLGFEHPALDAHTSRDSMPMMFSQPEDYSQKAAEEHAPLFYKAFYGNNVVPFNAARAADHYSYDWPNLPGTPHLTKRDFSEQENYNNLMAQMHDSEPYMSGSAMAGNNGIPMPSMMPSSSRPMMAGFKGHVSSLRGRMTMLADHFTPNAPDGDTPSELIPDFAFSDQKKECEALSEKHSWDPVRCACVVFVCVFLCV